MWSKAGARGMRKYQLVPTGKKNAVMTKEIRTSCVLCCLRKSSIDSKQRISTLCVQSYLTRGKSQCLGQNLTVSTKTLMGDG